MLVYEFMPNGTLRDWISGMELWEIFVLKLAMLMFLIMHIS